MVLDTFKKETKELWRDGRVRIAFIIVLFLTAIATYISTKHYQNINEQYLEASNTERDIWDNQGEKNPHSAAHYGTYAFKPKYPLSLIDQGVDKYTGTSIFLEAHKRNEAQFIAASDQTGLARFGDLTPDFILLFIIPLLLILVSYNSVTKEKERGTLTLLRSQGAIGWKIVLGKWLAIFSPIFVLAFVLFLLTGVLLSNLPDFGVFNWSSLFVLFGTYMVYYAIFINLVLIISASVKKSGIALVLSLSVWILVCLVLPKVASNLAEYKYPYPTRQEFSENITQDKKQGLDGHNPWSEAAKELEEKTLKEYGVDSLSQLPFNYDAYRMQKGEEHEAEIYFKHYNYLKTQYANQSSIYQKLAAISPYLSTRFLSMAIAKTDYDTHWDFSDAAENYRIESQKFLNDHFAKESKYGEWGFKADAEFWKKLPKFTYEPPSLSETIQTNKSSVLMMLVWLVGSFTLLFFTTKSL
ncbi:ABC transporter permease [Kordia sp.]|uniref:ABC transporter permease n=1 Tax=Kordia sp. TaxID=1965332 RepID=UPI003B5A13C7